MKSESHLGKTIGVYETFITRAWKTTHDHKELWFFGILTSWIASGSILITVIRQILHVRPASEVTVSSLEYALAGEPIITSFAKNLIALSTPQFLLTISLMIFLAIVLVIITIGAQQVLVNGVHRSARKKKHLTAAQLLAELKHLHFWRLFALNALVIIATLIITSLASLLLSALISESLTLNFLVYIGIYAVTLPPLLLANIMGMSSIIHMIRKDTSIDEALHYGYHIIKKHWLVALELSIILLFINAVAAIIVGIVLAVLVFIMTSVFFAALFSGSVFLTTLVGALTFILGIGTIVFITGIITTFNYSAWTYMLERLDRFHIVPAFESALTFAMRPFTK
jgi:hypothetical protein